MKGLTLSVSQLNEYVRKSLASDPMLHQLCLTGEISNFKRHVSGHWYFSLKDEDASISCVMFRQSACTVRFRPENGVQVRLFGSVGLYGKTGSYQFYADAMEQDGLGELFLRFEALKAKLTREGLFDPALKKPLPLLPRGVGIITSKTGAVVHDIAQVAWRRNPAMPLYLYPVKVQGAGAAEEIAAAIKVMDKLEQADVLIVGRGGGSMEDLWAFNEEIVARAIAACRKPVVSAVGHETDFTIADFAASVRAATPSAAAELCVPRQEELYAAVDAQTNRVKRAAENSLSFKELRLSKLEARIAQVSPEQLLQKNAMKLRELEMRLMHSLEEGVSREAHRLEQKTLLVKEMELRLERAASDALSRQEHRLQQAVLQLRTASPMETIRRGYAVAMKNGTPLKSVHQASAGDRLNLILADGSLTVAVETIEMGE